MGLLFVSLGKKGALFTCATIKGKAKCILISILDVFKGVSMSTRELYSSSEGDLRRRAVITSRIRHLSCSRIHHRAKETNLLELSYYYLISESLAGFSSG